MRQKRLRLYCECGYDGIAGSGDFARNAHLAVFVTKSSAKGGSISSVVPMVSHVDHSEHDVDILVTEIGLADFREELNSYYARACQIGGHTPHILREALSWHINLEETGHM